LLLLEEMIHFNDEGNFDRIVGAELAIAQALKMDPIIGKVQESRDSRYQNLGNRAKAKNKSKMFVGNTTASRKNKLFV